MQGHLNTLEAVNYNEYKKAPEEICGFIRSPLELISTFKLTPILIDEWRSTLLWVVSAFKNEPIVQL